MNRLPLARTPRGSCQRLRSDRCRSHELPGSYAALAANSPATPSSSSPHFTITTAIVTTTAAATTAATGPGRRPVPAPGPTSPGHSSGRVGALGEDPVDQDLPLCLVHLPQHQVGNLVTVVPGHLRNLAGGDDA